MLLLDRYPNTENGGTAMNIWLPNVLYQFFPLLSVITGFLIVALIHNPFAVLVALFMYVYAFIVMWLRMPDD